MRRFTKLFRDLDESNRTGDKVAALRAYFHEAPAEDAAWVLWFLWGNRLNLKIPSRRLRQWAADLSGYPDWLVEACYERVGDLAETGALLLPLKPTEAANLPLHKVIETHLLPLRHWDDRFQFQLLREFWLSLDRDKVLVLNKMLTGGFRIGVSRLLVVRALSEALGIERATLTHRLMGDWEPDADFFHSLTDPEANAEALITCPYPFYLASPISQEPSELGKIDDWIVEWKWDGIRAQLICREGTCHIWSRGEERVTDSFPELVEAAKGFPDGTVLDGEILCWEGDSPLGFHVLQTRLNRKKPDAQIMETAPVVFMAYDCLEQNGKDIRDQPLANRKAFLEDLMRGLESPLIRLSPVIQVTDWQLLEEKWSQSRQLKVEGLMLKHRDSAYKVGRVRGEWWKWKVDPYTADLVMVYAQAGHGRRASLYTDYTLAASDGEKLVPVAKAYSGLTDEEIRKVDNWIKRNTLARRGPVRTVPPEQVFEIGFEGLRPSSRHKSGLAMRFPRILRWRRDKPVSEIDTVDSLRKLIE
ncbi:ATP-dependent DNA ligase [Puniceicoccales bacterium CK1056]|uniref:DNA ligase (ATP) n=1 Tax=Oceanipulchritudo coccoides TaxID=2706888 RepID=A0A6B2M2C4_9BACT|nr:ATP-dependent DNA ligase [Oceanipulchritudo coccoides]NDV62284.1 ATP-dependent DNA ligase [Oceanipulchritudo coccoides]